MLTEKAAIIMRRDDPGGCLSKTYIRNRLIVRIACSNPAEVMQVSVLLGALTKLRKATVVFVTSVCPSIRNNSAPSGRIFMKFYICVCFENPSRNSKVHQNVTKITGLSHENRRKFLILSLMIYGDRGGTVVKVLCYKSEGRWFDPRWCPWNFSLT